MLTKLYMKNSQRRVNEDAILSNSTAIADNEWVKWREKILECQCLDTECMKWGGSLHYLLNDLAIKCHHDNKHDVRFDFLSYKKQIFSYQINRSNPLSLLNNYVCFHQQKVDPENHPSFKNNENASLRNYSLNFVQKKAEELIEPIEIDRSDTSCISKNKDLEQLGKQFWLWIYS